jgi:multidrug efflux system membrane fusion protein
VLLTEEAGDPTTVRAHPVSVGDAYGNMVQVLSGLKAGDRVVTSGATLVKSGDQVRIVQ